VAAGAIYRALEPGQRVHVIGVEMDPVKMWEKLAAVHVQKVSGVCFNTLGALLAVRKSADESLPSVVAQVDSLLFAGLWRVDNTQERAGEDSDSAD
jgi:hypothetical protein